MITPAFDLNQDDTFLYINVKLPSLKFNSRDLEISITDNIFIFYLDPYYLRLTFSPNELLINNSDLDLNDSQPDSLQNHFYYDSSDQKLKFKIKKKLKNQHFNNLHLPNLLLSQSNHHHKIANDEKNHPLIQEITPHDLKSTNDIKNYINDFEKKTGKEFNWQLPQFLNTDSNNLNTLKSSLNKKYYYGFNNSYNHYILNSLSNGNDINELSNPEQLTENERITERKIKENYSFNSEYYINYYLLEKKKLINDITDVHDYNNFASILHWTNPFVNIDTNNIENIQLSKEEHEKLVNLPKKHNKLIPNNQNLSLIFYLIFSLLYGYNYNLRENLGDDSSNIETPWLIGKLIPQFSCLDQKIYLPDDELTHQTSETEKVLIKEIKETNIDHNSEKKIEFKLIIVEQLIITLIKRSLIYPLNRNFNLSYKVLEDVIKLLEYKSLSIIIKQLIKIREFFRFHQIYYVYNIIYLNDLIKFLSNEENERDFFTTENFETFYQKVILVIKDKKRLKDEIIIETLNFDEEDGENKLEVMNLNQVELIGDELYNDYLFNLKQGR
ncbi:Hsp90 cochaperone SHQ1 ASCRUDRAFT_78056 [Ascoidea rubescens DSM 1968]|uniref:CS domain-containing protein n=1 Tax=Ascoidea rubescens DSM 1968 TaxID=1344418 RepID=A0A1D2V916_9ASCO|nr:hypothetical protein ASCRUDRAFT_78056 [Ascoidea rubescens DSM 1968]ODV58134.1 hypothetical protein ASCRUDRAFT_78056 [Ascoidea rubescens DSM 1968]